MRGRGGQKGEKVAPKRRVPVDRMHETHCCNAQPIVLVPLDAWVEGGIPVRSSGALKWLLIC